MNNYIVHFEFTTSDQSWYVVEAESKQEATDKAYKLLIGEHEVDDYELVGIKIINKEEL